jgi:hypothetical protein
MTRGGVAKRVREHKDVHPELYCPWRSCLWRTGGALCPKHQNLEGLHVAGRLKLESELQNIANEINV